MKGTIIFQINYLKTVTNMKYLKLIIFLFFSHSVFSQNLESLKELDTIYVCFNYGKHEYISDYSKIEKKNEFNENIKKYTYELNSKNTLTFIYNKYKDFDSYEKNIVTDIKIVKKKFLRKNKNIILSIDFFIENGFKETFFKALYGKVIYIIDKGEIKKGKVKLKQVSVMSNYIEE